MEAATRKLWADQDKHGGDRWRLFQAVAAAVGGRSVLYPGSFVDVAASFVWPVVTYVDVDRRAARFFTDVEGVAEIVGAHPGAPADPVISFVHGDYTEDLGLAANEFDLLVSLYAGFVSDHCTGHLKVGGHLLVNPSHGDAALASIDRRYTLSGVVLSRSGQYVVSHRELDTYLVPKKPVDLSPEAIRSRGKGVAYSRPAFAYLFRRVA